MSVVVMAGGMIEVCICLHVSTLELLPGISIEQAAAHACLPHALRQLKRCYVHLWGYTAVYISLQAIAAGVSGVIVTRVAEVCHCCVSQRCTTCCICFFRQQIAE